MNVSLKMQKIHSTIFVEYLKIKKTAALSDQSEAFIIDQGYFRVWYVNTRPGDTLSVRRSPYDFLN